MFVKKKLVFFSCYFLSPPLCDVITAGGGVFSDDAMDLYQELDFLVPTQRVVRASAPNLLIKQMPAPLQ